MVVRFEIVLPFFVRVDEWKYASLFLLIRKKKAALSYSDIGEEKLLYNA